MKVIACLTILFGCEKAERIEAMDSGEKFIVVKISEQTLYVMRGDIVLSSYAVSTSKYGIGNASRSNKTPLGTHRICEKIGEGAPEGMIFKARIPTGEIAQIYTDSTDVEDDYVTTRILRLEGLEEGINRGEGIDSFERYIYIHGTPEEGLIGKPSSHGCVRMKNADVVALFDAVDVGILVEIVE